MKGNQIVKAIEILRQGGIVIFPTDTVYGIGCRMDDEAAVQRVFSIRKRPETKATPVLVSGLEMAQHYLQPVSQKVIDRLITPYWPGGLTIVLPCQSEKVPVLVRGGGDTIGVRMPNHPTTLSLIEGLGIPILGPSANFSEGATPQRFPDLNPELVKLVDFVVEGECGLKQSSTVIDTTVTPWKILRQGAVQLEVRSEK
jgi:L-threonylcarbamoyladenylate synthase